MYYYQHHIGDYRKDTSHLSLIEHGIYRQLLDLYYITEKPLDKKSIRLIGSKTDQEIALAELILNEFFEKKGTKYYHKRCDDEIQNYKSKSLKASESSNKRWNNIKRLDDANALPTQSERNANQEPITNNQKPKYIPPIPAELLSEWLAVRKKKPVTERVFNSVVREANKIGWTPEQAIIKCCERGWTGFEASWIKVEEKQQLGIKDWI